MYLIYTEYLIIKRKEQQFNMEYDAIVIVSFGGPEKMVDVKPYLDIVLKGKNVPEERKLEVVHHYELFNGVSPINEQNRLLIKSLKLELSKHNIDLPVYWGNRNWHPFLTDTIEKMTRESIRKALAFVTSAYSSYSGCRQYCENIQAAREQAGSNAPVIDKIRTFYNHPGFIQSNADNIKNALAEFPEHLYKTAKIFFTAHSIPHSMAQKCDYEKQLLNSCQLVAESLNHNSWDLVYQSRSGPPHIPWLEPDICDYLKKLKDEECKNVVLSPIGFVSDHMEILFDLDTEAGEICNQFGINMVRAKTAGVHPAFITMIRELICERLFPDQEKKYSGSNGPSHDFCAQDCCMM